MSKITYNHIRVCLFAIACLPVLAASAQKIRSTEQLLAAVEKRYYGKAARQVTFTQYNTHYKADTVSHTSIWYEAIRYPSDFRIDLGEVEAGNAALFTRDSVFSFREKKLAAARPMRNTLILLAGGLYHLPAAQTLQRLKEAGYKTDIFREDKWLGKPVYVIGAAQGDEKTLQCWYDKKNLHLVRTIEPQADGSLREAHFKKHVRTAGGWTETEVLFLRNGKPDQLELYKDLQVRPVLDDVLFDPYRFWEKHWKK